MKICLDVRCRSGGGLPVYINNLVPRLLRMGSSHTFLIVMHRGQDLEVEPGVEVVHPPQSGPLRELGWVQAVLPGILDREQIDVYHALKHLGPLRLPCPSVVTLHEVGQYVKARTLPLHEHAYWRFLQPPILRRAAHVIANSEWTKEVAAEQLGLDPSKVTVVPLGLNPTFLEDSGTRSAVTGHHLPERFVLAVGNISPKKNFGTIVEALATLRGKGISPPDLVIAGGEGYKAQSFWSKVEALGLKNSVHCLGFVQPEALKDLYVRAEALVYPSLYEAFGLPPVEAMACGCPVITTRRGAIPEVTGGFAWFMKHPTDSGSLSDLMIEVSRDRATMERKTAEAKQWSERYSWDAATLKTLEIYDSIQAPLAPRK